MSFSIELMHIFIENEGLLWLRMKNGQPLFMNDLQVFLKLKETSKWSHLRPVVVKAMH